MTTDDSRRKDQKNPDGSASRENQLSRAAENNVENGIGAPTKIDVALKKLATSRGTADAPRGEAKISTETPKPPEPKVDLRVALKIDLGTLNDGENADDFGATLRAHLEKNPMRAAKVGEEYRRQIQLGAKPGDSKRDVKLDASGFEDYGLSCAFENDALTIFGVPKKQGDLWLAIETESRFRRIRETGDSKFSSRETTTGEATARLLTPFLINPDPWSLWKEKDPPKSAPYQKPNGVCESGDVPGDAPLKVLAASLRGRSHAHNALFRDDDFKTRLAEKPGDWSFVAVSDGAGSAKFSRKGSEIACETVVAELARLVGDNREKLEEKIRALVGQKRSENDGAGYSEDDVASLGFDKFFWVALHKACSEISEEAKRRTQEDKPAKDYALRDYSATLLCVAFKRFEKTDATPAYWAIFSYWVGDGGLAIVGADSLPDHPFDARLLGTPDGGESAGQTRFLAFDQVASEDGKTTPAEIRRRVKLTVASDFTALVLMSDGLTDPLFISEKNRDELKDAQCWQKFLTEFVPREMPLVFDKTKKSGERAKSLLNGLNFKVPGNHDDRTLVLIFPDGDFPKKASSEASPNDAEKERDNILGRFSARLGGMFSRKSKD